MTMSNISVLSTVPATAPPLDQSLTIDEFCRVEDISRSLYFKLRRLGYGPAELRAPGTGLVRVSASARRAWQEQLEELGKTKAGELERRRRVEQRRAAGRLAAQSVAHVSRRGPRTAKGRRSR